MYMGLLVEGLKFINKANKVGIIIQSIELIHRHPPLIIYHDTVFGICSKLEDDLRKKLGNGYEVQE